MDRDVIQENTLLLLMRWKFLRAATDPHAFRHLGFEPETAEALVGLDEPQVKRAGDAAAPLFHAGVSDEILMRLVTSHEDGAAYPLTDADRVVQDENSIWLLNRWTAARQSPRDAEATYGLSSNITQVLREATLADITRTCRRGARLAAFSAKGKYFFHAGRNLTLSTAQRTVLATCSTQRLK